MTCDTFATESFGNPVTRVVSSTLPGASAHRRLLVSGTQITVAMRLLLRGISLDDDYRSSKPRAGPGGRG